MPSGAKRRKAAKKKKEIKLPNSQPQPQGGGNEDNSKESDSSPLTSPTSTTTEHEHDHDHHREEENHHHPHHHHHHHHHCHPPSKEQDEEESQIGHDKENEEEEENMDSNKEHAALVVNMRIKEAASETILVDSVNESDPNLTKSGVEPIQKFVEKTDNLSEIHLPSKNNKEEMLSPPLNDHPDVDTSNRIEHCKESQIPESSHIGVKTIPPKLQPTSWKSCCGLFELLMGSNR